MRNFSRLFLLTAVAAFPLSALAGPGDRPVSSSGPGGPAPRAEAAGNVNPSLGTGGTSASELQSRGVTLVTEEESFPSNGMATVAYGSVGKRGESIINWDSRTRAYTRNYPTRAVVFIEINGAHLCTGFMYSPSMVTTAGHCVHTGGTAGAWRNRLQMKVYAARDGATSPHGFCTVARLHSVVGWTRDKNFRFDYGAMRLNCTIGNTVGWFGLYEHTSPTNQPAIIHGYPGDKPRDQWTAADKIRQFSAEMIAYRMDSVGGHSGSPVWHDRLEGTATNGAWAIGVHNYGVGAFGSNTNSAARLTQVRINNYVAWRDAP